MICGSLWCSLCGVVIASGVVLDAEGTEASSGDGARAAALEEIGRPQRRHRIAPPLRLD